MSLTTDESRLLADREELLNLNEIRVVDATIEMMFSIANTYNIQLAGDDRCAKVEAALIKFINDSREEK